MKLPNILQRYIIILILLGALLPAHIALAEDNLADIQQRINELNKEAAETNDVGRLLDIASQLSELSTRLQVLTGELPAVPIYRAKTPDEEINREMLAINGAYERLKLSFADYKGISEDKVAFQSARKLHGRQLKGGQPSTLDILNI